MQYTLSTIQSQNNMNVAAPEVHHLLKNLSDSLEKFAHTSSLSYEALKLHNEEMRCHNAKMHQQLMELIKMNERAQELQEKTQQIQQCMHQDQMQYFQEMQELIKHTLAKITQSEEPRPRNTHLASQLKARGSLGNIKTQAKHEAFFECSQSQVLKKESSSEEDDESFLQKMKIQDFIKNSYEKLDILKFLPFKCESFLQTTDKILSVSSKIEMLQAKSITTSELEDLRRLRVFVKRFFVQRSRLSQDDN